MLSTGQNRSGAELIEALELVGRKWSFEALTAMEEAAGRDTHLFVLLKEDDSSPRLCLRTPGGVLDLDHHDLAPSAEQAPGLCYLRPLCELSPSDLSKMVDHDGNPIPADVLDELRTWPETRALSWRELNALGQIGERFRERGEENLMGPDGRPRDGYLWCVFGRAAGVRTELRRPVTAAERLTNAALVTLRAPRRLLGQRLDLLSTTIGYLEERLRDRRDITLVTIKTTGNTVDRVSLERVS
ncbi:hypothetical protein ACQPZP_08120 [Spirillospora sp. CA-142024]|uniref:hypothetical protein n=1 Tax=Spirillospora sp. CA-142024 TaxID=3240036 RepID=UPI003D92B01E